MEAFNNLMGAFMGKDLSSGLTSSFTASLDTVARGDYFLSSFKYEDDKAGVYMEIARVMKIDECATVLTEARTIPNERDFGDNIEIVSIKVMSAQEVTFALRGAGDNILLKSDFNSMGNYVAQRNIEGMIYLNPASTSGIPANIREIRTHGLENAEPGFARQATSVVMDFLPFIGTTKSISELIFGYDPISGEKVHRVVAGFGVVASFVPIPGAAKAGKLVGKALTITTEVLAKKAGGVDVIEKNIGRLVAYIPRETPEILRKFKPQYEAIKAFTDAGYKGASRYYVLVEGKILHAGDLIKRLKPEVQDQLKHMSIPEKPLVPGGGLLRHEMYDEAHTIEKHVGKSDEYLKARVENEAPRKSGEPRHYSTFNNLEEAEYFVAETINKYDDKIAEWLFKTKEKTGVFEMKFNKATGKLLKEGENSIANVDNVRIVLKRAKGNLDNYVIKTAYPIEQVVR